MATYTEQVDRICYKLKKARKKDTGYKVFGSSHHKYKIGKVIAESEVSSFEEKYKVALPECYKSFVTRIGNGGVSHSNSAAGPFYGIYPFAENIHEIVVPAKIFLSNEVKIYPNMSDAYWDELTYRVENDEDISENDYDEELSKIFGGILPIGSQGCSYVHGLVLQGVNKGKVVNLDISLQKPQFTFEDNFLDWYERWLDEVISGKLINDGPNWFGYSERSLEDIQNREALDDQIEDSNGQIKESKKRKWFEIWK
ncbi:SMI1/KNR4 family protein [Aureisphaera galaxeae]|uniref:SMI1/KNR4 family protein n=1 Tax=Aureisphaera galaxeae TaxID=1538023 RepID=UPI0023500BEC|nr:SMI1/KNR4 family protein [Aureisphaera galaxeae]MDC8002628.1 SMI1/KNR4 family protein [Aureisphaera galaxeae]